MTRDLILDTHTFLWLMNGDDTLGNQVKSIIREACKSNLLLVPSISIWEIAMLQKKNKISLLQPIHQWIEKATSLPYLKVLPLDAAIAIESCKLPGEFHGDPADRIIVASARILDKPLITRDRKIIEYAQQDYLTVIPC